MKKAIEKIPKILPVFFLLVLISFVSKAQNSLTGTVTDSKGAPVQGVNVTIKGTKTTTQTAADGTFKITSPTPTATLVLSSVGYGTQEISVTSGTAATVALTEKNQQLNEVVVVGYGTMRRKDVTSSITTVSSKDLNKGVYSNRPTNLGLEMQLSLDANDDFFKDLVHPDDLDSYNDFNHRLAASSDGVFVEGEFRMRRSDGTWMWRNYRNTVLHRHPDGTPSQYLGTVEDITQRKTIEAALVRLREQVPKAAGSKFVVVSDVLTASGALVTSIQVRDA